LDVSQNDGHCRLRTPKGLWVIGMFRRLSNSLFMDWRSYQPHPEYLTTTDFQAAIEEQHLRRGSRFVNPKAQA
jgi:hypothetical protein